MGLVEAVRDPEMALGQIVRIGPPFNLAVLPAGTPPATPCEVLKAAGFASLLERLRHRYDYIVIDTPPLVAVPDCRVIEREVDGFVVVVAARRTPRRLVEEAVGLVAPGKLVGLVFNGSDHPRLDYEPVRRGNGGASRRRHRQRQRPRGQRSARGWAARPGGLAAAGRRTRRGEGLELDRQHPVTGLGLVREQQARAARGSAA